MPEELALNYPPKVQNMFSWIVRNALDWYKIHDFESICDMGKAEYKLYKSVEKYIEFRDDLNQGDEEC